VRYVAHIGKSINAYKVCSRKRNRILREITINWMMILKWSFRECTGKGVQYIHVALYTDHCLVLENIVMTIPVR
jgi:hypothetical protein